MSQALTFAPLASLRNEASKLHSRFKTALKRYALAWRFATGSWSEADALHLSYESEVRSGCFSLESISTENVLERIREIYRDDPAFADLAYQAVRRAWNKWESGGDLTNEAEAFAIEIFREYAMADGVPLIELTPND